MIDRDRDNTIDIRLAGVVALDNAHAPETGIFTVDLPAPGQYQIQIGAGDAGGNPQTNYILIEDSTTVLAVSLQPCNSAGTPTFCGNGLGNAYTAAAWPGSEATVTETFATTKFNLVLGGTAAGNSSVISTIFIHQVTSTPSVVPQSWWFGF